MQVLVLAGGLSAERDVSLRSGRRVAEALRTERPDWEVLEHDVDSALLDRLRVHRPDCIVPLLHGAAGEDGALRDVLESLRIPFVGSTARGQPTRLRQASGQALGRGRGTQHPGVRCHAAGHLQGARRSGRPRRGDRQPGPPASRQADEGRLLAGHLHRAPCRGPAGRHGRCVRLRRRRPDGAARRGGRARDRRVRARRRRARSVRRRDRARGRAVRLRGALHRGNDGVLLPRAPGR